jgi:hypothetical protein
VHSKTCIVWILMCRSGVGSIFMIFDVLDCYILYVFVVVCILYTCFRGSPDREADKIGKKIKKNPYVRRLKVTWEQMWLVGSATWQLCLSKKGQHGSMVSVDLRGVRSSVRWNRRT